MHSMQTIAESGSKPMQKQPLPAEGMDARMAAVALIAEMMAHVKQGAGFWHSVACRLVLGTTDMRAAFIKGLDAEVRQLRKEHAEAIAAVGKDGKPDVTKEDRKFAGSQVNTATVYVSHMRTIAHGFNSGATVEGLLEYAAQKGRARATLDQVGWTVIRDYASQFKESKGGRKADPWLVKFSKWLDSQGKPAEDDALGQEQHAAIVQAYNTLVQKYGKPDVTPKSAAEKALF